MRVYAFCVFSARHGAAALFEVFASFFLRKHFRTVVIPAIRVYFYHMQMIPLCVSCIVRVKSLIKGHTLKNIRNRAA